ncbi:MAG: glutamate--tRNA ligase [Rhodospirillales bacterium]|nr:MAG: glutamate--tRNA ligase [Rhodospirillales bacterium]
MSVVTRFAPSPTGFLHIGGARTALFNWLFARHHEGRFCLRIEDTDRARSTPEAVAAIFDGLTWLGLGWDGEPVSQSARAGRHAEVARVLQERGHAYPCYASAEELVEMRDAARAAGRPVRYDGRWRDRDPADAPPDTKPVIRFKAPTEGETSIDDQVQGRVTVANAQLDDMVLLRADGSPTYMLAVVVDDHDMAVTHIIRGDDHLTNAFRQLQLYRALDWTSPAFAHIPLIHGPDGAKLSKRHGALGVDAYRDQGFLPEAMVNYLLRLGWSHGDDEIIDRAQAIAWFDLAGVGKSPARFDAAKLTSLNAHYLRRADDRRLVRLVLERLCARYPDGLVAEAEARLLRAMPGLKERARTVVELADAAAFLVLPRPVVRDADADRILDPTGRARLAMLVGVLRAVSVWEPESLERAVRDHLAAAGPGGPKLRDLAQPLRAALTGRTVSPPIFDVMAVLGREESLGRLADTLDGSGAD